MNANPITSLKIMSWLETLVYYLLKQDNAPKYLWGTRKVRFSSYSLPHDRQTDEVNLNLLKKHIWWTHLCQWNRATFQRIHNHKSSKHQLEACKFKTGWIHFKHFLRYYLFITIQFSRYSNGGFHFYIQYVTF